MLETENAAIENAKEDTKKDFEGKDESDGDEMLIATQRVSNQDDHVVHIQIFPANKLFARSAYFE